MERFSALADFRFRLYFLKKKLVVLVSHFTDEETDHRDMPLSDRAGNELQCLALGAVSLAPCYLMILLSCSLLLGSFAP